MPTKFYETLGARLRARREEIHLRQAELAESVGLSRTSITNIELGRQRLFLDQFAEICRNLKVVPSEMIPQHQDQNEKRLTAGAAKPQSVQKFLASVDLNDDLNE
jgi:transcriptional regulator with XRE-family HTH domain